MLQLCFHDMSSGDIVVVYEASYGIIPLAKKEGEWQVLLIQHGAADHWAFPKGHAEEGEEPRETASRELFEETGLTVSNYLTSLPFIEKYQFFSRGQKIEKTVTYFLAEVTGELNLQVEEIRASRWVPLSVAADHVTFPAAKTICNQVIKTLA